MTDSTLNLEDALASYESGDFEKAFRQLTSLADAGDPAAQFNLGKMYAEGDGAPKDMARAYFWLEISAAGVSKPEFVIALREQLAEEMSLREMTEAKALLHEFYAETKKEKVTPLCVEVTQQGHELESFFKILRGNEGFFVRVPGEDLEEKEFYEGIVDNDLYDTDEHGLSYGDPVRFALGEIIPPQFWSPTGGLVMGMYRYTLAHLRSTDETKHGLHIRPAAN